MRGSILLRINNLSTTYKIVSRPVLFSLKMSQQHNRRRYEKYPSELVFDPRLLDFTC